MVGLMKTVSMGTSASGGSHSRMSYNFCYKRRPLSPSETGWDGASLPHTHTRRRTWSGPPRIVWGREQGRKEKTSVCMCWESLGGVAEEEHLTRHCQGTHE